jgi:hypothetical protein
MKNTSTLLLVALCMLAFNFTTQAQSAGIVFRDFNGNGTKETNEPFLSGITVNVYNAAINFAVNDKSLKFWSYTGFQPKKKGFQPKLAINTN